MRPRSPRSILLGVALASMLALSACGQRTQPTGYGEDYQKNFMLGCNEQTAVPEENPEVTTPGPEAPKNFCECVYDGLVEKVPFDDAKKFEEQQAKEDAGDIAVPKPIQKVIDSCNKES